MKKLLCLVLAFAMLAMSGAALFGADAAPAEIVEVAANNSGTAFKTVKLPAMKLADGEKAVLTLRAWNKAENTTGWTRSMMLRLNGKVLGNDRALVRKELVMVMKKDAQAEKAPLFDAKNQALLFYTSDPNLPVDKRITADRELGSTFKLDVTDLVSADRENFLTIHNVKLLYQLRNIFKNPQYEFIICAGDIKLTAEKPAAQ